MRCEHASTVRCLQMQQQCRCLTLQSCASSVLTFQSISRLWARSLLWLSPKGLLEVLSGGGGTWVGGVIAPSETSYEHTWEANGGQPPLNKRMVPRVLHGGQPYCAWLLRNPMTVLGDND